MEAMYRPLKFNQVLGQEVAVKLVKNALIAHKFPRTAIFYGPSGVGKTTIARLVAAWGVCRQKDDDLCGNCDMCKGVQKDSVTDIIEFDAASNTSIEDIRAILDQCNYAPQFSSQKVFIIDEAHMLSRSAISALLKTFEETPEHVRFIMATTEIEKIPDSIKSRCFCIPLQNIKPEFISATIQNITDNSDSSCSQEAVELIISASRGSMREAISIFKQCEILGNGDVTYDVVHSMLGFTSAKNLQKLTSFILGGQIAETMKQTCEILSDNVDPVALANQMRGCLRDMFYKKENDENILALAMIYLNEITQEIDKNACAHEMIEIALAQIAYKVGKETSSNKPLSDCEKNDIDNNQPNLMQKAAQLFEKN